MPTSWWYILDGVQHGPVPPEGLKTLIHQQVLSADALVWRAEYADWRRIGDVPELTAELPAYRQVNTLAATDEWWYVQDGASHGPVDPDTLRALLQQGRIGASNLVWNAALSDWTPAGQLRELLPWLNVEPSEPAPAAINTSSTMAAETPAPAAVGAEPVVTIDTAGPWRRLFARLIDIYLLLIPIAFFSAFLLSSIFLPFAEWIQKPGAATAYTWLLLPVVMLIEALIYAAFGNTIGKMLFGIRVTSNGADRLPGGAYLKRQLRVYWCGLATGFPVLQLIAMLRQYFHCKKDGQPRYDEERTVLIRGERGIFRTVFSALLLIVLGVTLVILNGFIV